MQPVSAFSYWPRPLTNVHPQPLRRQRNSDNGSMATAPVPKPGLAHLYVLCKGGNDEVGGRGWKIGTQAALVPTFAKPAKVGQPPNMIVNTRRTQTATDLLMLSSPRFCKLRSPVRSSR
jgi:hypothetical protein